MRSADTATRNSAVIASFDLMYDYHISVVYYAQFFQGYNTPGRNAELPRNLEIQKSEGVIWLQK
jgi:hypothetical protein